MFLIYVIINYKQCFYKTFQVPPVRFFFFRGGWGFKSLFYMFLMKPLKIIK